MQKQPLLCTIWIYCGWDFLQWMFEEFLIKPHYDWSSASQKRKEYSWMCLVTKHLHWFQFIPNCDCCYKRTLPISYISSVNIFFSSSNFSIHRKWIIHGIPDTLTLCPSVWQIPFCYRSSNYVYTVFDLLWYMAFLAVFVHVRCIHMYHVPRVLCVKTCVIKKMAYHSIETGVYMNRHIREMYLHVSWHVQTLALYQNKIIVSHEPLPDPHLNHGKSVDNNLQLWPAISNLCLIWRKKYFWSCPS